MCVCGLTHFRNEWTNCTVVENEAMLAGNWWLECEGLNYFQILMYSRVV